MTSAAFQLPEAFASSELGAIFDELPDGVVVLHSSGVVLDANAAFVTMIGRSKPEVIGRRLDAIVSDEDMLCLVGFEAMFGAGPLQDTSVIFTASDGSRRPMVVCACPSAGGGRVLLTTRVSGTVQRELADASRWVAAEQDRAFGLAEARDALAAKNEALRAAQEELQLAYTKLQAETTVRERLEQELQLAHRLEAIGQLAAGVAHEINTPLQYVGDSVHFLAQAFQRVTEYIERVHAAIEAREAGQSADEMRAALAKAQKAAKLALITQEIPRAIEASKEGVGHVSTIVQALKAFSHGDDATKAPHDINQAIQNTLVMCRNEYKDVAVVETDLGDLPPVYCLVGKLNQVFLNLIVNAAHAIADSKRSTPGTIRVRSRAGDGDVEVTISDDGCGIPHAIRHKIFEQFFTTKEVGRGSGQGLSLARRIVTEVHGGTLTFESEVGQGTAFTVRIPIGAPTPA